MRNGVNGARGRRALEGDWGTPDLPMPCALASDGSASVGDGEARWLASAVQAYGRLRRRGRREGGDSTGSSDASLSRRTSKRKRRGCRGGRAPMELATRAPVDKCQAAHGGVQSTAYPAQSDVWCTAQAALCTVPARAETGQRVVQGVVEATQAYAPGPSQSLQPRVDATCPPTQFGVQYASQPVQAGVLTSSQVVPGGGSCEVDSSTAQVHGRGGMDIAAQYVALRREYAQPVYSARFSVATQHAYGVGGTPRLRTPLALSGYFDAQDGPPAFDSFHDLGAQSHGAQDGPCRPAYAMQGYPPSSWSEHAPHHGGHHSDSHAPAPPFDPYGEVPSMPSQQYGCPSAQEPPAPPSAPPGRLTPVYPQAWLTTNTPNLKGRVLAEYAHEPTRSSTMRSAYAPAFERATLGDEPTSGRTSLGGSDAPTARASIPPLAEQTVRGSAGTSDGFDSRVSTAASPFRTQGSSNTVCEVLSHRSSNGATDAPTERQFGGTAEQRRSTMRTAEDNARTRRTMRRRERRQRLRARLEASGEDSAAPEGDTLKGHAPEATACETSPKGEPRARICKISEALQTVLAAAMGGREAPPQVLRIVAPPGRHEADPRDLRRDAPALARDHVLLGLSTHVPQVSSPARNANNTPSAKKSDDDAKSDEDTPGPLTDAQLRRAAYQAAPERPARSAVGLVALTRSDLLQAAADAHARAAPEQLTPKLSDRAYPSLEEAALTCLSRRSAPPSNPWDLRRLRVPALRRDKGERLLRAPDAPIAGAAVNRAWMRDATHGVAGIAVPGDHQRAQTVQLMAQRYANLYGGAGK